MKRFVCVVPFDPGERWRRWNFFSLIMHPVAGDPQFVSASAEGTPAVREVTVVKTSVLNGWEVMQEVIQVYVALEQATETAGRVLVTLDAGLDGELVACAEASDACLPGESG